MRRVVDKRNKEKFFIDDKYLNGYAKLCGWQATLVYIALCRHANEDQESFPSIKLLQEKLGIARNSVIKGLERLEQANIIKIEKRKGESGKWINNAYILLDKSVWKRIKPIKSKRGNYSHRVPDKDMDSQVPDMTNRVPDMTNRVPDKDTKEPHSKEPHLKEPHLSANNNASKKRQEMLRSVIDYYISHYILKNRDLSEDEKRWHTSKAYKQYSKAAKELLEITQDAGLACEMIDKADRYYREKGLSWTLYTVSKYYPEIKASKPKVRVVYG